MNPASSQAAKRRFAVVATTLACLIGTDAAIRLMKPQLREYNDNPYARIINSLPASGVPDIVLMGSSRALCGFVPAEFEGATGKTVFNATASASMAGEWQLLAKRLFAVGQPKIVVLGINAHEIRTDYTPSRAARYLYELPDVAEHLRKDHPSMAVVGGYLRQRLGLVWALYDQSFNVKMWAQERLAPVLPQHAQLARKLRERVTRPRASDGDFGIHEQWVERLPTHAERLANNPQLAKEVPPLQYSPDADSLSHLAALLAWFQDRRIAVLVVYIPNSPGTEELWQGVEPTMIKVIGQTCQQHGAAFLGCNSDQIPKTDADFIDKFHVGVELAKRISSRAAHRIIELGLLQDTGATRLAGNGDAAGEVP